MYKLYLLGLLLANGAITGVSIGGDNNNNNNGGMLLRSRELVLTSSSAAAAESSNSNTRQLGFFDSIACGLFGSNCDDTSSGTNDDNPDKKNETDNNDEGVKKNDTLLDSVFGDGGIIDQILGGDDTNSTKPNATTGNNGIDSVLDFLDNLLPGGDNTTDGNWTWDINGTDFGNDYNNTVNDLWNGNGTIIDLIFGNQSNFDNWLNQTFGNLSNNSSSGDDKNPIIDLINNFLSNLSNNNTTTDGNGDLGDWFNNLLNNFFNNTTTDGNGDLGDLLNGDFINNLLSTLFNGNNTTIGDGDFGDIINSLLSTLFNNTDGNNGSWLNGTFNVTGGMFDSIFGNLTNLLSGNGTNTLFDGLLGGDAIRNASTVSAFVGDWFDEANFVDDKICKTSDTAPACNDMVGKEGFWVCRTLSNPFSGNASSKSVCISKGQYLKGNDACGCCEPDGCPVVTTTEKKKKTM